MLLFKKIRYKNFISTGNHWTEIELNKTKTTILFGKNGTGKSTFTDAITFALYGKPFRKINKPQLINTYNRSEMVCEIEFNTNGKEYLVRRGQKPNIFEIYEDEKLLNQDSSSYDYQEYLQDRILKMNYKSFVQIIVVGSATYIPFMQLIPNYRRAVVEDLLNIDIISKMNVALKRRIADHSILKNEIERKYEITKEKIKIHNEYMKTNMETVLEQIQRLNEDISKNTEKYEKKKKQLEETVSQINDLSLKKDRSKKILDAQTELDNLRVNIQRKIKDIESSKKFFENQSLCPKCLQGISHEHKTSILESKEKELDNLNKALNGIQEEMEKLSPKIQSYVEMVSLLKDKESEKMKLEIELESISKYGKKLGADLSELQKKKEDTLKNLNENMTEMKAELEFLSKEKDALAYKSRIYDIALSMLKDDGIKTKIIKYYLPTMNKLINKYLALMNFNIGFELNENFEEIIHNAAKRDFTYENFSEGEKLRIDLAILFAWRDLSKLKTNTNINLLIMDEILDSSLDSEGIDDFIRIIKTIIDDRQNNVFIITHKDEQIADKFHRAIKFEKADGRFTRAIELVT